MTIAARLVTWRWTVASLGFVMVLLALFARVGGDWDWLAAMGDHIRVTNKVPDRVPFAEANSTGWHNVPVVAELVASVVQDLGARAAIILHLIQVAVLLAILATAARDREAGDAHVATSIGLLALGGLATLGVLRAQTLSLIPFALVSTLIAYQARRPDSRIWWVVPLVALWGNLHGAALLGVCVVGAYLVIHRIRQRPRETVAVGVASLLALCATPQLWSTPVYYAAVFDNVAATRAEGLWARPSLGMPFDVLMLGAAATLLVRFLRTRRQVWEYVAVAGLCVSTASAARHGIWLLILLVVLAMPKPVDVAAERRPRGAAVALMACGISLGVALPVLLARGDAVLGAPPDVVNRVESVARGRVVLAPAPLSESLAVAGVRLWVGNPLDAFSPRVQAAYLDFLEARPEARPAIEASEVVVVRDGSPQEGFVQNDPSFEAVACGEEWTCYVRN